MAELCPHKRIIGSAVCQECPSGLAEKWEEVVMESKCSFCDDSIPSYHCPKCSGFDNEVGKKDPQALAEYWLKKFLESERENNRLRNENARFRGACEIYTGLMREVKEIGRRLSNGFKGEQK